MTGFFSGLVEFQKWGWNPTTVGFLGTIVFGLVLGWGLYKQVERIRENKSGKSIAMTMCIYFAYHFFTFSVYGYRIHSLAVMLNGLLGFFYLWIYMEAAQYPDSPGRSKWEYAFAILPFVMALVPYPKVMMAILFIPSSILLLESPFRMWCQQDAGAVEPKMSLCFMISAIFWLMFSYNISDRMLVVVNIIGIVVMVCTLALYVRYRKPAGWLE